MMKLDRRVLVAFFSVIITTRGSAIGAEQDVPPETLKLIESAGAYLGALELLRQVKISECGYALRANFRTVDDALQNDVLPAVPPRYRQEVEREFQKQRGEMTSDGRHLVEKAMLGLYKEQDRSTACGSVAGSFSAMFTIAWETWIQRKQKFGWKGVR